MATWPYSAAPRASYAGVRLEAGDDDVPAFTGHREAIRAALVNLMLNGIDAAGAAWDRLRALELPPLGRDSECGEAADGLEEAARRAAPRLAALNFRRHLYSL